jgi:hypothetical protein
MKKSLVLVFAVVGCGSSPSSKTPDAAIQFDASKPADGPIASHDAPVPDAFVADVRSGPDAFVADAFVADAKTMATLTVKNYLNWCDVTVNGTKFTASAPAAKAYPIGTVIPLSADTTNATLFVFKYWRGTDNDPGTSPYDNHMSAMVTMSADKTIQACCPDKPAPGTDCLAP